MPWKKDANGAFVIDDNGNPIFTLDSGEDRSVDYPAMSKSLSEANRESAGRKDKIRALEEAAKVWEGIDDVAAFIQTAKRDADTVKAMGDKEKTAEEAARARVQAAVAPLEKKIAEMQAEHAKVLGQYHASAIRGQFGTSKFVNEELVSPALAQELFAKFFSVDENGAIVGKDSAGNVIYDEKGPAGFDFALRQIVNSSPYKGNVIKGSTQSGSGANPRGGRGGNGLKTMTRSEFDKLGPAERAKAINIDKYKIVDG